MHHDGRGYAGAFVYFLSPAWRTHWGGMLLLADEENEPRRSRLPQYTGSGGLLLAEVASTATTSKSG
jgi:hypothetical protein